MPKKKNWDLLRCVKCFVNLMGRVLEGKRSPSGRTPHPPKTTPPRHPFKEPGSLSARTLKKVERGGGAEFKDRPSKTTTY